MSSTLVFYVPQNGSAQQVDFTAIPGHHALDADASSTLSMQMGSLSPVFSQSLEYVPECNQSKTPTASRSSPRALAPRKGSPRREMHIPRPRNPFMIYRSEVYAQAKITSGVERDHRHISRIIGHLWNKLSEAEKAPWRLKAEQEKIEHQRKYPGYRFAPGSRAMKPVKRNVKRNGSIDLARCKKVADLLMAGKQGDELESAVQVIDAKAVQATPNEHNANSSSSASISSSSARIRGRTPQSDESEEAVVPLFRSPLLPPRPPPETVDAGCPQFQLPPPIMDSLQPDTSSALGNPSPPFTFATPSQMGPMQPPVSYQGQNFVYDNILTQGHPSFLPRSDAIAPEVPFLAPDYQMLLQLQAMGTEYQAFEFPYPQAQGVTGGTVVFNSSAGFYHSLSSEIPTAFTNPFDPGFSFLHPEFRGPVAPLAWDSTTDFSL